jgi:putative transposase
MLAEGEYYHVINRGAHRQGIFKEKADWQRLLFCILYFQSLRHFPHVSRIASHYSSLEGYPVSEDDLQTITEERVVDLVCFALMPNHIHLLLKGRREGGIASYMQQVAVAYTKYFNTKYESSGHLFQGRYKTVHVKTNEQLTYLSAYIHRNPREIKGWKNKEEEYPWSSLQDYVIANRWGGLLATDIIAGQFDATKKSNYRDFVRMSGAKTLKEELSGLSVFP